MNQDPIGASWLELILGAIVALLLLLLDGNTIAFIRNPLAPEFTVSHGAIGKNAAFIEDHNLQHRYIIMSGDCEFDDREPPPPNRFDPRVGVSYQLRQDFIRQGLENVHVFNLSAGGVGPTWNLHMFLRFLEDPRFRIFIWQCDFNTKNPRKNKLIFDDYVRNRLYFCKKRFPNIPEIDALLQKLPPYGKDEAVGAVRPEPEFVSDKTSAAEIWQGIRLSLKELGAERIRQNTAYLREIEKCGQYQFMPYRIKLHAPLVGNDPRYGYEYTNTLAIQQVSGPQACEDIALTLRIIGKLANAYGKKVFVLFGLGALPCNQEEDVYTRKFKIPIMASVGDLPAVKIIDLSNFKWKPQDLWGKTPHALMHVTQTGSEKYAAAAYSGDVGAVFRRDVDRHSVRMSIGA